MGMLTHLLNRYCPPAPGIPHSRCCQGWLWVLRHPRAVSHQQVVKASQSCSRIQPGHPGPHAGPKRFRDSEARGALDWNGGEFQDGKWGHMAEPRDRTG